LPSRRWWRTSLVIAAALSRYVRAILFGVAPADPSTLAGALAVMMFVALMAGWFRHGRRLDSILWLRCATSEDVDVTAKYVPRRSSLWAYAQRSAIEEASVYKRFSSDRLTRSSSRPNGGGYSRMWVQGGTVIQFIPAGGRPGSAKATT
jgi:hypothetical protein